MSAARHRLDGLTELIVRASRSWRVVAGLAVAFVLLFGLLMAAASAFEDVTGGLRPFDLQNRLDADQVRDQLARYPDAATARYLVFAAVDLLFPLAGAALLAVLTAACLRTAAPRLHARLVRTNAYLLFAIPALLDWTENGFALWLVLAGPPASAFAVDGLVVAKQAKLVALWASQSACAAAIVWWLGTRLVRLGTRVVRPLR